MAADANGFDLSKVLIPSSSRTLFAPISTTALTKANIISPSFVPGSGWRQLQLSPTDGGPEFTNEDDGDAIEFFQEGYSIPSGNSVTQFNITVTGEDELLRELRDGSKADAQGFEVVEGGSSAAQWRFFTKILYKSPGVDGRVIRNVTGVARVVGTGVRLERGTPTATELQVIFQTSTFDGGKTGKYAQAFLWPTESV